MVTWKIDSLKVVQTPQPNTVTEVVYVATHSDGPTRSGTVTLGPPGQSFAAFESLTEQQVLEWLWGFVGKDATEEILTAQAAQTQAEALPWVS